MYFLMIKKFLKKRIKCFRFYYLSFRDIGERVYKTDDAKPKDEKMGEHILGLGSWLL